MYTREKLIKVLNVINIIILIGAILQIILGVTIILDLTLYYWGDWETVRNAKATPESIFSIWSGALIVVIALYLLGKKRNARFYSSFFECDLDGRVDYKNLSEVTGKSIGRIKAEFMTFMRIYMKRFACKSDKKDSHIELYSKTVLCSCAHCGAQIEKKEYFAGVCPYCSGSDLNARVLTDHQFYSISNDHTEAKKSAYYYQAKNISKKKILSIILVTISSTFVLIMLMYAIDSLNNFINYEQFKKDYYYGVLFEGAKPKADVSQSAMASNVVAGIGFSLGFGVFDILGVFVLMNSIFTESITRCLALCDKPFLTMTELKKKTYIKKPFKRAYSLIRNGYLKNCTFEKHRGHVKMALAKKIVKDICPHCGAPITGVVDDKHICAYCRQPIMGVLGLRDIS